MLINENGQEKTSLSDNQIAKRTYLFSTCKLNMTRQKIKELEHIFS